MIKVIFILLVLGFVGYGVYMSLKLKKETPPTIGSGSTGGDGPGGNRPNKD